MNTMCSHQSTLAPFFVGVCAEPPGATARSAASSTLSEWMFLAVYLSPFRLVDFYRVGLFAPNGCVCCYVKALADPEPNSPAHCVCATL